MAKQQSGYRIKPSRTALLVFEDGDYAGAEVRVALTVPIRVYLDYLGMSGEGEERTGQETIELSAQMLRRFGEDVLQDWNLQDRHGGPIPADATGILAIPSDLANLIVSKWLASLSEVSAPLGPGSNDGDT